MLALVLGLQGIRSVSNSVTNTRPAPLSPASVKAAVQRASAVASAAASSDSDKSAEPTDGQSSSSGASGRGSAAASTDDRTGVTPPSPASASSSDTSGGGVPAASSSSSSPRHDDSSASSDGDSGSGSSSSSSSVPAPAPQDKTYQLVGGSVGIRFEDGAAHLLWASPNSGFSVESSNDGGTVDVRFRSDNHESRLRAYWDNGPQQVIEENDDGG
jgi:hypothetical protein